MYETPILDAESFRQHENIPFSMSNAPKKFDRWKRRISIKKIVIAWPARAQWNSG